ncbi:MAG: molybdopterin-dependent oxidoreductase [Sulfuricella sp.]|nr:molybdopterin-dependent oxidoreductase [Sulfuricella sp.]
MTDKRIPGYCPLCISRCGCVSVVNGDGILTAVEPDPGHPTGQSLCIKGRSAPDLVNSPDRILYPMKRTRPKGDPDPGWVRITWDEALEFTAGQMKSMAQARGPESVAFSVATPSGTAIADGMGWIFRLINAFGSPNAVWTTHVCNWHRDFTNALTFGCDIGMPDYANTGCIVYWGFNPAVSWPAQARLAGDAIKRGAKLVVIDPRRAGMAAKADQWLRVRPGTDGALALSLAGVMIEHGWYDADFVRSWSNGPFLVRADNRRFLTEADLRPGGAAGRLVAWDEENHRPAIYDPRSRQYDTEPGRAALFGEFDIRTVLGTVACTPAFDRYARLCRQYAPERAERITGVPAAQIRQTARLLHEHAPVSYYAWSGIGQNTNASQTARAVNLLYALTGGLDASGGNVHFARPALNDVSGVDLRAGRKPAIGLDTRPLGPARHGWISETGLYRAILDGQPYPVKGLVAFGSNLLQSRPDPVLGAQALQSLDFYVHADMFLNPMAELADIVLPVATPWEREGVAAGFQVSQEASALVQLRHKAIEPRGESKSDTWIAFELAKRLQLGEHFFDGSIEAGVRHVLAPTGIAFEALRNAPAGIRLPLPTPYRKYRDHGFNTPSSRVEIYSQQLLDIGQDPLPEFFEPALSPASRPELNEDYPLILTSAKWVQYCHSQFRQLAPLRRRMPDPLAEIHPDTAAVRGIMEGDWIGIRTPMGKMVARAAFNAHLEPRVVCAQYGWWEAEGGPEGGANFSALIDGQHGDPVSGSVALRSYLCEVEKYVTRSRPA